MLCKLGRNYEKSLVNLGVNTKEIPILCKSVYIFPHAKGKNTSFPMFPY